MSQSKAEVRTFKGNDLLAKLYGDDPMPREGELFIDEYEMFRVISVQHEYKGWRRQKVVVLVEHVAKVEHVTNIGM